MIRETPLPRSILEGHHHIPQTLWERTWAELARYGALGHEGIAYWGGVELPGQQGAVYLSLLLPRATSAPRSVSVARDEIAHMTHIAHGHGLGVLAQIHTHPGPCAQHSDGDDHLVLMPSQGMLSLVFPGYALGPPSLEAVGVHQYQQGRWSLCTSRSVFRHIHIHPNIGLPGPWRTR